MPRFRGPIRSGRPVSHARKLSMGRWHCSLAGLLGMVTLFAGCATNRPGNPFTSSTSSPATKKAAADNPEVADRKMNTHGRTPGKTDSPAAGADSQRQLAANDRSTQLAPRTGGHDPETQAYIDQELRDATPEERANYQTLLNGQHPDAIRQILHSRRLTQRAVQKQREIAGQRPESYSPPVIQTAGAEAPAPTIGGIRRVVPGEGLGSVSAWPRQSGDANRTSAGVAFAGTIDGGSTAGAAASAPGGGQAPLGHSSGYRVDPEAENQNNTGYATVRPGPTGAARIGAGGGPLSAAQYNVTQAGASIAAPPPRGSAVKPAAVAIGTPMSAGAAPQAQINVAPATSAPADGVAREQLARYISMVESEAFELQPGETEADKLAYVEKQVHLRMLYLMSGQQERALQAIPGLDPADQEFWQQTFWGLANYFDVNSIPSSPERAAQTVTQMTNAVLRLQEKARLELRNVTFCHKISSFGNYEKYPR